MALVVFLRGVNVGGRRTFRPTTLTKQLAHLNALNIGAAGTFVIRRPVTHGQLRAELASKLPFDTESMICQGREIVLGQGGPDPLGLKDRKLELPIKRSRPTPRGAIAKRRR